MTMGIDIKKAITDLIIKKGPIGWMGIELGVPIQRAKFKDGYNIMTYLNELERDGEIVKLDDGKYKILED